MKKWLLVSVLGLCVVCAFISYRSYLYIFQSNVDLENDEAVLDIYRNTTLDALADTLELEKLIQNKRSFLWVSSKMKFESPKPGRYLIRDGMNNRELVCMLRSASQEPVKLTFNNVRTLGDLCVLFGTELEADSSEFCSFFTDSLVLDELGLDRANAMSLFIPNTYEVYWNIRPVELLERMKKEYDRFWTEERLDQLDRIGLNREQCYTLASIVQKETNLQKEKSIIAGVYLNRLERGILLQADPTVIFATGDFEIRRVLNRHLALDSPYNTYLNPGLPPGPICMPDISTIDATLNAADHAYIYFCVKPGTGFEHAFARTLREHNINARAYRQWLNKSRIYN